MISQHHLPKPPADVFSELLKTENARGERQGADAQPWKSLQRTHRAAEEFPSSATGLISVKGFLLSWFNFLLIQQVPGVNLLCVCVFLPRHHPRAPPWTR